MSYEEVVARALATPAVPGRDENSRWARTERWLAAYPLRTCSLAALLAFLMIGVPVGVAGMLLAK